MKTSLIALAVAASLSFPVHAQVSGSNSDGATGGPGQTGQGQAQGQGGPGQLGQSGTNQGPATRGTQTSPQSGTPGSQGGIGAPGRTTGTEQTAPRRPTAPNAAAPATSGWVATTEAQFRQEAMNSDAFELRSSRLAIQRSRNQAVRSYARDMVRDHGKSSAMLMEMGNGTTATAGRQRAASTLDPRRAQMYEQLRAQRGRAFDALYVQMQVQAHEEAVTLFTSYSSNGSDPALRAFATETLPTLREHLAEAQQLQQSVPRSATRN